MFKILILLNKFVTLLIHKYILNHGLHRNSTFHMFFTTLLKNRMPHTQHPAFSVLLDTVFVLFTEFL